MAGYYIYVNIYGFQKRYLSLMLKIKVFFPMEHKYDLMLFQRIQISTDMKGPYKLERGRV